MFSSNGDFVFIWNGGKDLRDHQIWNLNTGSEKPTSPELAKFLSASSDATLQSMSGDGESFLMTLRTTLRGYLSGRRFSHVYEPYIINAIFSPNGLLMADGQIGGNVYVRPVSDPQKVLLISVPHLNSVTALAFSSDSQLLAIGEPDGTIDVWDISDAYSLPASSDADQTEAHHDSNAAEKQIVHRLSGSKIIRTFKGHLGRVVAIAFSTDGMQIVSRELNGVTKLWSLDEEAFVDEVTRGLEDLYGSRPNLEIEMQADGMRVSHVNPTSHEIVEGKINVGDRIVAVTNEEGYRSLGPQVDQMPEEEDTVYRLLSGPHDSVVAVHLETRDEQTRVAKLRRSFRKPPGPNSLRYSADGASIYVAGLSIGHHGT